MLNNEAQLKAGFNSNATRTGDPLDNVNEFCENMHFVMTQVEFDCLSAAVQIYHSDELVDHQNLRKMETRRKTRKAMKAKMRKAKTMKKKIN